MSDLDPANWTEHSDTIPKGFHTDRMVIHHCLQGSEEWENLRKGRPTASRFSEILTPKGDLSKSAVKYAMELIGECFCPTWSDFAGNKYTDRGTEMEPEALQAYADMTGYDVRKVGFVTRKDGIVGCSPDAFIWDSYKADVIRGVEAKCKSPKVHIATVLAGVLPDDHKAQVHGSMVVTGMDEWDFFSYFPGLKPFLITVKRDEYTEKLSEALDEFLIDYASLRRRAIPLLKMNPAD